MEQIIKFILLIITIQIKSSSRHRLLQNQSPAAGDFCGWPPKDCPVVKCHCISCPDGIHEWCGCATKYGCTLEYEEPCKLECSGAVPYDRVCVGCDINHCIEYFDGCNKCKCGENGLVSSLSCTEKYCDKYVAAKCLKCEKGYALNPTTDMCEEKVGCNINHCIGYYDGCNWCHCNDNGMVGCTRRFCLCYETPKCTECEFGYHLDTNNKCIKKTLCKNDKDCDIKNQFLCHIDPICQKTDADDNCRKKKKVCVNLNGQCVTVDDCDVTNGFECIVDNIRKGICVKYQ
eukprot:537303_1